MGGGVGISIHGKYRISTENTLFAMPETAIGLFPDVGSMYWMSHMLMPSMARYLALTGARLKAPDLLYAGLATHYVPSKRLGELQEALVSATASSVEMGTAPDVVAPILMSCTKCHRKIHNIRFWPNIVARLTPPFSLLIELNTL
jgi:enoyl-CoA hydratase/carnithine racemase